MSFLEILKNRRSIYHLGSEIELSEEEIATLVKDVVRESPTSFNAQTQRVVVLFNGAHEKLWDITEELLKPLTPVENFPNTQEKLAGFKNAEGTLLFFEDTEVVESLQERFALYSENFPIWSEQGSGIAQANVWNAFTEKNIGANLQHYNPVIDERVSEEWDIPKHWKLRAQLVFGSIETEAAPKEYMEDDERFLVFK